MRQLLLILLLTFSLGNAIYSQMPPQGNVSTPKGSAVTAYITPEMSSADRAYWDTQYASTNRRYIEYFNDGYSSSFKFNCHGYAWNMIEGGPARWIGYSYTTDEDIYMTDGSYIRVCNEVYPGKVSWVAGDHSAVTTSTPGRWISKWNKYPLMEHYKDDTPFGTSYAYYASTKISGDASNFCSGSRSFSVQNITGATYSWTCSSSLSVIGASNGNQFTVEKNLTSNEAAWVQVQISTACSGTPIINRLNLGNEPPNSNFTSIVKNTPEGGKVLQSTLPYKAGDTYEWRLNGAFYSNGVASFVYGPDCNNGPYQTIYDLELIVTNPCGQKSSQCVKFEFVCSSNTFVNRGPCGGLIEISSTGSDYQYQYYPNPAESELNITRQAKSGSASELKSEPVKLRLYNAKGEILRSGTIGTAAVNDIKWNTLDLIDGTYFLHIFEKSATIKKQVLIKH
jgi:hypothetical protein